MKKLYFYLIILVLIFVPNMSVSAASPVLIYEFYGNGCPHCTNSFVWFDYIEEEYGKYFDLVKFEVWYNQDNSNLMMEVGKTLGDNVSGVPYIVVGDKSFIGFGETSKQEILDQILFEYENINRGTKVSKAIYDYRVKNGFNRNNKFISQTSNSIYVVLDNVIDDIINKAI